MSAKHSTKWYWSDWLGDPAVRSLTPAERGVWIDLIGLAAAAKPVGYVLDAQGEPLTHEEIARVTNAGSLDAVAKLIEEIVRKGAASRDRAGRLYNRRQVRDVENSAKKRRNGRRGGLATQLEIKAIKRLAKASAQANAKAKWDARLSKKESLDLSSEQGAAREAAVQQCLPASADPKKKRLSDQKGNGSLAPSSDLIAAMQRKGWAKEESQ